MAERIYEIEFWCGETLLVKYWGIPGLKSRQIGGITHSSEALSTRGIFPYLKIYRRRNRIVESGGLGEESPKKKIKERGGM